MTSFWTILDTSSPFVTLFSNYETLVTKSLTLSRPYSRDVIYMNDPYVVVSQIAAQSNTIRTYFPEPNFSSAILNLQFQELDAILK